MSTRTTLRPFPVIVAGSMAGNITSSVTVLQSMTRVFYQAVWSGSTAVGALSVQVSGDYLAQGSTVLNAGTWTTITVMYAGAAVSSVPVTGSSGSAVLEGSTGANAVRLVYTSTSGAGTMNATVTGKVS